MSHTNTSFLLGSCVVAWHVLLSEQSSVVWKQSLFSGFGFVHPCLCCISQLRNEILNLMTEQMDPASLAALVLLGQSCRLRQARLLLHSLQIVYLQRVCSHAIFYYSLVSLSRMNMAFSWGSNFKISCGGRITDLPPGHGMPGISAYTFSNVFDLELQHNNRGSALANQPNYKHD